MKVNIEFTNVDPIVLDQIVRLVGANQVSFEEEEVDHQIVDVESALDADKHQISLVPEAVYLIDGQMYSFIGLNEVGSPQFLDELGSLLIVANDKLVYYEPMKVATQEAIDTYWATLEEAIDESEE